MSNVLERDIEPRVASDVRGGGHLARPMLALCTRACVKRNLKGRVLSYDVHQHLCECVPLSPLPLNGFMRGDPPSPLIKDGGGGVGGGHRWPDMALASPSEALTWQRRAAGARIAAADRRRFAARAADGVGSLWRGGSGSSRLRRQHD